jgi:Sulfotransferase family
MTRTLAKKIAAMLLLSIATCVKQMMFTVQMPPEDLNRKLSDSEPSPTVLVHHQQLLPWNSTVRNNLVPTNDSMFHTTVSPLSSLERIAFFHVGKTGGTTLLSNLLSVGCKAKVHPKLQRECLNNMTQSSSILSQRTQLLIHLHQVFPQGPIEQERIRIQHTPGLLFSIREPIARFESAYYYDSPFHCSDQEPSCKEKQKRYRSKDKGLYRQFFATFPSMENLTLVLQGTADAGESESNTPKNTTALLSKVFRSVADKELRHLSAGYRHYTEHWARWKEERTTTSRDSTVVLAIRTEHLWSDAETIDAMLGGIGNFSSLHHQHFSHGSEHQIRRSRLVDGSSEIQALCCALWEDIQAYRRIVEQAVNLNQTEKNETFHRTWQRCAVSSWEQLQQICTELYLVINPLSK